MVKNVNQLKERQKKMYKSLIVAALLAGASLLSACGPQPVSANCAAVGAIGGALLGSATHNDIAQSALAGGAAGGVAGTYGMCN
jgi:hypothetical protein